MAPIKNKKSASNSLLFCQEPVKNTRKKSQQKSKQLQPHPVNPEQIVFFKTKKDKKSSKIKFRVYKKPSSSLTGLAKNLHHRTTP